MRKFDSINVIPFIDIMLVLLAIVLTTATFVSSGQLDISLPAASTSSVQTDRDMIEIAIDRDDQFFLDGEVTTIENLKVSLESRGATVHVRLLIDESVEFQRFVMVIDLLNELAMDDVSVVTRTNN